MAKCWMCSTRKGKRYCIPLDKLICPTCCAESRQVKIACEDSCRYLEGASFQEKRTEDKKFAELMYSVGHGKFDDIFREPAVACMAYEIESLVRDIYVSGNLRITDTSVYQTYKTIYAIHYQDKLIEESQLDEFTVRLLEAYRMNSSAWKADMDEEMVGQVFLRLMISVKKMSGGRMGEYGYLNYLKNNLEEDRGNEVVVEDKFGNKIFRELD
jgi:hypothetical protein